MQTSIALVLASDENNPITAAITSAIDNITNSNKNNDSTPTNSNNNSGSTITTTTTPITPPITQPSPTPDPITLPITNPSPTPKPAPQGQPGNNSSSQPGNSQAPVCGDSKPVSAPKLLTAYAIGKNKVALVWSRALDPVSYYLVAYGTKPGKPEFGNPNIGGKNTTSFIVSSLSGGQTYYFKVRAGNGCMPGDFSNEMAVKVVGDKITTPAAGFKPGVLGVNKKIATKSAAATSAAIITPQPEATFKPITSAKPDRVITGSRNSLRRLLDVFQNLFKK